MNDSNGWGEFNRDLGLGGSHLQETEVGGHYQKLSIEEGEGNDHTRLRE